MAKKASPQKNEGLTKVTKDEPRLSFVVLVLPSCPFVVRLSFADESQIHAAEHPMNRRISAYFRVRSKVNLNGSREDSGHGR
jgi:hypothetical protein